MTIRRRFLDVPFGQMHYRTAGDGPVLVLFHASPGSSRQLETLIRAFAVTHRVIAPDTPGNGDSDPLPIAAPAIADYAAAMVQLMAGLGVERADVYGSHTGSCIAAEVAILAPLLVRRVVHDGAGVFTEQEVAVHLANYAQPFEPDLDGAYLMRAFMFCRDQFLFFPWYARSRQARRDSGMGSAQALHLWVIEVLKAAKTYPLAYRAAFSYPTRERLPLVTQPTLCMAAEDDPLCDGTREVAPTVPGGRFVQLPRYDSPDYVAQLVGAVNGFLADDGHA
jgi:pimeloyl-ACP methyl ester carboxylesterase